MTYMDTTEIKNHGLDWDRELGEQSAEDWIFGATEPLGLTCITDIPEDQRDRYLPAGEVQKGAEDMMDCATRAPLNILEEKFNWLLYNDKLMPETVAFLKENGYVNKDGGVEFSDAFIAILSGTTRTGNSLKAPIHAIHSHGLIPKSMLPLEPTMTWEEYHDPARITPALRQLGAEFLERFAINYSRVELGDFPQVIKRDLLDVGGYAWPKPIDGEYPKTDRQPNHAFVAVRTPQWFIFDNYIDRVDNDFIKKLAPDYALVGYGYRVLITRESLPMPEEPYTGSFWRRLIRFFIEILTAKVPA